MSRKSTGETHCVNCFHEVYHQVITRSQNAKYQGPGSGSSERNALIMNVIDYSCASPAVIYLL